MSKFTMRTALPAALACLVVGLMTGCAIRGSTGPTISNVTAPASLGTQPDISQSGGGGAWKAVADTLPGASQLFGITAGPDGNVWFADAYRSAIGRIDMSGKVTEFTTPTASAFPYAITVGPDGNLWFTETGIHSIGRITTAGVIKEFPVTVAGVSYHPGNGIVAGPDHNLWFTLGGVASIMRSSTSGGMRKFDNPNNCIGNRITVGSDGDLWFSESCMSIDELTPAGMWTHFPLPNSEQAGDIVSASDGALYFSEAGDHNIGKITPPGVITLLTAPYYVFPSSGLLAVGNQVWFNVEGSNPINQIGRLNLPSDTFGSALSPAPAPLRNCCTTLFANGPDGNVWFTVTTPNVGIYITQAMKLVPLSATISVGAQQTITVTEKSYTGSWTASTSKPAVATVMQGGSSDQFVVTGNAAGSCKITIKDSMGNSAPASITVM